MRVPKAGGTLFKVDSVLPSSLTGTTPELNDSSLLLLADILPTGVFAALQALQHAKLSPMLAGLPYPPSSSSLTGTIVTAEVDNLVAATDRVLIFAIVGLGPVGVVGTPVPVPLNWTLIPF